jgi:hypothetical protein
LSGGKNGARVGEAWIGDRMACVTEVKFGTWREEGSVLFIPPRRTVRFQMQGRNFLRKASFLLKTLEQKPAARSNATSFTAAGFAAKGCKNF